MASLTLHEGDCIEVMAALPENHFDAIVTDPPYHLASIVKRFGGNGAAPAKPGTDGLFQRSSKGFMGKEWDGGDIAFRVETWAAALRVLKPGGHLVAFSAAKTYHHMSLAIEVAGFEMRDAILSLYSASDAWRQFLDSLSPEQVGALARACASADAPLLAWLYGSGFPKSHDVSKGIDKLLGAARAEGVAKGKSKLGGGDVSASGMTGGTYYETTAATPEAAAWEGWGAALKPGWEPIVLARKPLSEKSIARQHLSTGTGGLNIDAARIPSEAGKATKSNSRAASNGYGAAPARDLSPDRWPANVVHDGSPEVLARFPVDTGASAARFFYSAKASDADRAGSDHPTVKPQSLMRWLVKLTTDRGANVLDMFGGSGSTAWAAATEGRNCHLIERDPDYAAHIRTRLAQFDPDKLATPESTPGTTPQPDLFGE
ncbi:DNA-methyltransferase [Roseobacter litoralis]|uniref:DNA-methyltransferase n=1 Tax=Roseobacter litoralis TaxID=42443 RepID=UPI00249502F3|nr:DNA methyltransferase [Roseobacter litoralis]